MLFFDSCTHIRVVDLVSVAIVLLSSLSPRKPCAALSLAASACHPLVKGLLCGGALLCASQGGTGGGLKLPGRNILVLATLHALTRVLPVLGCVQTAMVGL